MALSLRNSSLLTMQSAGAPPRPEDFDKATLRHFKRQTQDNLGTCLP